ncbi:3-methyladenine DNA glycosylase [Cellulomonas sp. ATA003]|nr:3-methyladenine DNA glycosylase [Cellulomonas sp. ATA003]WNB84676.1 3-methyladenine DNA glycosylase [Cellulomonas sp. ATA003]
MLPASAWGPLAEAHAARVDTLTAGYRDRRSRGERHPIDDFLYDYYNLKPSPLRRWHPGAGVVLSGTADDLAARASWRWHRTTDDGVTLDVAAFLADRGDTVRYIRTLLAATASRPAHLGCLGLHEWAMVYREDDARRRHSLPLRLGREGTDAVVESHPVRCTHFDAFRFFTPDAVARNRLQPTRATQPELEQPGCLHANMDLLKWVLKLGPAAPGDLVLDCFVLARDIRTLDMQASPYDVSSLGEAAVAIETPAGKAQYATRQRGFAERSAVLRERLLEVCERLVGESIPQRSRSGSPRSAATWSGT